MKTMNFGQLALLLGFMFGISLLFPFCSKETLQDSKNNPVPLSQETLTASNMVSTADLRNQWTWFSYTDRMARPVSASFEVLSGPKTAQVQMTLYTSNYDYLTLIAVSSTTAYPGNRLYLPFVVQPGIMYIIILKTWYKSENGDIVMQNFTSRQIVKISLDQQVTVAIPGPVQGTFITGRLLIS